MYKAGLFLPQLWTLRTKVWRSAEHFQHSGAVLRHRPHFPHRLLRSVCSAVFSTASNTLSVRRLPRVSPPARDGTPTISGESYSAISGGAGNSPQSLVRSTAARRIQIPIVQPTNSIRCAHRTVCRSQRAHTWQQCLNLPRHPGKVSAIGAAGGAHWPNLVQKSTNTWVDSTYPRMMLTTTPVVKA